MFLPSETREVQGLGVGGMLDCFTTRPWFPEEATAPPPPGAQGRACEPLTGVPGEQCPAGTGGPGSAVIPLRP